MLTQEAIREQHLLNHIIPTILLEMTDFEIIVLDQMTSNDQSLINRMCKANLQNKHSKTICIVHNWLKLKTTEEIQQ